MKAALKPTAREVLTLLLKGAKAGTVKGIYNRLAPGEDGYLRYVLSPAATDTGRMACSDTFLEKSCLTGDAEVLTPEGWRRFDALQGTSVTCMQWSVEGELSWCDAPILRTPFTGALVTADSWFQRMEYTPNHRIPYMHPSRTEVRECSAGELRGRSGIWRQPAAGHFDGDASITPAEARMLAAIQADFSISPEGALYFSLKKQAKKDRFRSLAAALGWEWTESTPPRERPGYTAFYVGVKYARPLTAWFRERKLFDERLLTWTQKALAAFVDELRYWDSHVRGRSFRYSTIEKQNAEWVATVAHLTGHSAGISVVDNRTPGSYGERNAQPLYTVNIKPRDYIFGKPHHLNTRPFSGTVYCVTTETSYFLVRRQGTILVTGNTNIQNLPNKVAALDPLYKVRDVILAPPGRLLFEADLSQAEARVGAWMSQDPLAMQQYAEGVDRYKVLAAAIYHGDPDKTDRVVKMERQVGKMGQLAFQFCVGWKTFMEQVNGDADITGVTIDAKTAKRAEATFLELHPRYPMWWQEVLDEVLTKGYLVNPFGRKRYFFGRTDSGSHREALKRAAVAFGPQSTIADLMNSRIRVLWERHDPHDLCILAQVHDAVVGHCAIRDQLRVARILKDVLEVEMVIHGRPLTVPAEVEMSYGSWSKKKEIKLLAA